MISDRRREAVERLIIINRNTSASFARMADKAQADLRIRDMITNLAAQRRFEHKAKWLEERLGSAK